MWLLLFIIPPVAALLWMQRKMDGFKAHERKWLMVGIVVLLAFYFGVEKILVSTGEYPFACAKLLHDLSLTLLMPMAYLLFGYSLGIKSSVRNFTFLLLMSLVMLPEVVATVIDISRGVPDTISTRHNYMHFELASDMTLEMQLYSLVVASQAFFIAVRAVVMRRIFVGRNLSLTDHGRMVAYASVGVCCWVIITLLPTHSMLVGNHLLDIMIIVYCVITSVFIVLLSNYFNSDVVVDSQQHVVSIEDDVDSTLGDAIQILVTEQKVYRNSNLRIEDLASMVSSNRTYVARVCRLKFGKTFTELMNYHRVEDAKEMLVNDRSKRMDQIASECGFSSASFFARVFKANVGMTPTQWRTTMGGGQTQPAEE